MMNKLLTFLVLTLLVFSCSNPTSSSTEMPIDESRFPENLKKVFAKHGSLAQWQKMNALSYEIVEDEGNEKQFIHLKDRRERIEGSNFITGYDGKNIWVEADTSYKGNPAFYYNLMFYFYAMPFVIADEGINYEEVEPLEFEGINYPGIRIFYDAGVGGSPKDEYFLYYHPETFQMEWLGYTVTYFSKEKSEKIYWIRYNDWANQNGILLPKSLDWYKIEEGKPTESRSKVEFQKISISETPLDETLFQKTAKAKVVE